ncbi:Sialic acid transporter NanT [Paraburkholderia fynbosensis]|uniref:Sialic acid transporter NanT n=1 Tax=Paraburkholderia fynbosensis TaxID=1200993 RepID=A0A6J5G0J0_9BURK|nr:Sialic acid transporter NanT [Paraburkholderia fynbosensis]
MAPASRSLNTRAVVAAVIGNALEWYDFTVFGFLTVVIAKLFFPASNDYASLLLSTATCGVAFVMRPIGGIVLGLYADRAGRKAVLSLVIALMTLGIVLLAIARPYSAIGIGAALMIVLGRLLQGFFAGGEFGSSTALLIQARAILQTRLLRQLADGEPGGGAAARCGGGRADYARLAARRVEILGLARALHFGFDHRAGRLVHPPASCRV